MTAEVILAAPEAPPAPPVDAAQAAWLGIALVLAAILMALRMMDDEE
jgi:hypothetical protein